LVTNGRQELGLRMAAAVLRTVPPVILFIFVQRDPVVGLGAGAVEG